MDIPDIILNIFKRKKRGENIIKRDVNILSVEDNRETNIDYTFAFDFIKEDSQLPPREGSRR